MNNQIFVIFRNDDLCALSDPVKERRILEIFEKYGIPQVFGVIPRMTEDPHDFRMTRWHPLEENPSIVALLKEYAAKGLVEIAQHGFNHQTNPGHPGCEKAGTSERTFPGLGHNWLPFSPEYPGKGYSEFNDLPEDVVRSRISDGRDYLTKTLGSAIETFIFPWDSMEEQSLRILEESGFRQVITSRNLFLSKKLHLVHYCHGDMTRLMEFIGQMEKEDVPTLTQVAYHSWMMDEQQENNLRKLLEAIHSNPRVRVILPRQIPGISKNIAKILTMKTQLDRLIDTANLYLGRKLSAPAYYLLDVRYYQRMLATVWLKKFIARQAIFRKGIKAAKMIFIK